MARFVRDEKRTFPFTWIVIGGVFCFSAAWALYAELVTRVPWQEHQERFYDLELELATKAHAKAAKDWEARSSKDPLKSQIAALAKLEGEMSGGDYKQAADELAALNQKFLDTENLKTFGQSDLDEAYYYRNLAEYARDAASVEVRSVVKEAYPGDEAERNKINALYHDPPVLPRPEGVTAAIHHLDTLIARAQHHADNIDGAISGYSEHPEIITALRASLASELEVKSRVESEKKHQARIDEALAAMTAIDGPTDPRVTDTDPVKAAEAHLAARKEVCQGKEHDSRNCIKWLLLGPKDADKKQLELAVGRAKRTLKDAELRLAKAKAKAEPEFDMADPMASLVGPFQIQQVVTHWIAFDRDVDIEQVDRCHTCHMGVDSDYYGAADIPRAYRTHPRRSELLKTHPIAQFGCTACHQGQGRATDDLAHSGWHLEMHHGKERWHFAGDHYWEDPMLPVGKLTKIVIDEHNDELALEIKGAKTSKKKIALKHTTYADEDALFKALKDQLSEAVVDDLAVHYVPVVRKLDNRITFGLEAKDPEAPAPEKPAEMKVTFTDRGMATLLGFGGIANLPERRGGERAAYTAMAPPVQPVRADNAAAQGGIEEKDDGYAYTAPRGSAGLQVPDEMRSRFIEALPEIESGCLRCHGQDSDLRPRHSYQDFVNAKLVYEKAQAQRDADPVAYAKAHGSDELPPVPEDPADTPSLAPTLDEGRATFRQLNCTGCHILEGFPDSRTAGPMLDDISAKVSPEWLLTWIRDPRGWRAKTSMPSLWPAPLDPASKNPYPSDSPEYKKWERSMRAETINVAAFLWDRSERPGTRPGGAPSDTPRREKVKNRSNVAGATAELGEKYFKALGCQGCHATTEGGKDLPAVWRERERDIAPNLANIGGKTTADWIAYWAADPSGYWSHTAMPNLRLSKLEAASIGKWLATLKTPVQAAPGTKVAADEAQIVADPKRRIESIDDCTASPGVKMTRVECGEKIVSLRGCFGCHEISGTEKLSLIGPDLTGFAKKDITTLDYGYAISDHHMQTTETFATLKLDSPRIYERDRIQLYMGDFDMSAAEIRALLVFLKGTVPNKPAEAFDPMKRPNYAAAVKGRQLVNDMNCRACHIIEGRGADIDGWRLSLLTSDPQRRAPYLDGEGARVQPEWLFDFLRQPGEHGIRPWLHPEWVWGEGDTPDSALALRMPTFNLQPEQWTAVVEYFATWDKQSYPFQVPEVSELNKEQKLYALTHMNSKDASNCMSCHFHGDFPVERGKVELKKMAPNFDIVRHRLRPEWVKNWLLLPKNYLPYTAMTPFWATKDRPKTAALWPREADPFISPPGAGWNPIDGFGAGITGEQQVELVRDFLFTIPADVEFPKQGAERTSVMVDPAAAALAEEDEDDDEEVEDEAVPAQPAPAPVPG